MKELGVKPKIVRYSKPMRDILNIKRDFFAENDKLLESNDKIRKIYISQPVRQYCKLCATEINHSRLPYFTSHGIDYYLCGNCGHLNGKYEDTVAFSSAVYVNGDYSENYSAESREQYEIRMEAIYKPKAEFLLDSLSKLGVDCGGIDFLDVGAGSGYMVGALKNAGVKASGIEVSPQQVKFANFMLGEDCLTVVAPRDIAEHMRRTRCQVLCFIGVLEHMYNLQEVLAAVAGNTSVTHMFLLVPTLSLTCALEVIFPNVFNRLLGGGHTHLFTNESIRWMCEKYGWIEDAKWVFGTDVMDLYRSTMVMLNGADASREFIDMISEFYVKNTDALQTVADRAGMSSEIHMLVSNDVRNYQNLERGGALLSF